MITVMAECETHGYTLHGSLSGLCLSCGPDPILTRSYSVPVELIVRVDEYGMSVVDVEIIPSESAPGYNGLGTVAVDWPGDDRDPDEDEVDEWDGRDLRDPDVALWPALRRYLVDENAIVKAKWNE